MSCRQISLARILWGSAPYSAHCSRRIYGALPQTPPSRFSPKEKRAAMCRSKFRGRANENGKFNLPRKHARLCGINSTAQTHKKQNRVLLPRFSPKEKRAAMCRSNFRGRTSKNNIFNLPRKHARFRAINASTKTQL